MTVRTYLDHAATTPVCPEAREAMLLALDRWANPSSPHSEGRTARAALEQARVTIAEALGWRHDVIFTSGASEAVDIAARRARVSGRVVGATEHEVVPHAMGAGAQILPVGEDGLIDMVALDQQLDGPPAVFAIQHVNNEIGVIQPLKEIFGRISSAGSLLLADCAQSAGKLDLPSADFIAVSAHKLGGPPGVGALLVRDLAMIEPSGGQEKGYRRGTQDLPGVMGMAAALEAGRFRAAMPRIAELRRKLDRGVRAAGGIVVAESSPRIANIGAVALPGASKASLLVQFDLAGIALSAGSACASGKMKESHVLNAMRVDASIASSFLRVSFGPATTEADVERFLAEWRRIAERRSAAA